MSKYLTLLLMMLLWLKPFAQDSTKAEMDTTYFEIYLDSMKMEFIAPDGLIETEVIDNLQMNYEKAFKHPDKRFEVRYAIRKHQFGFFQQMFEMTVLNISGGVLPDYDPFHHEAVKEEFGADAGATAMVEVGEEFGQDYKYCLLVYIFKKGVGDGYIFYLGDDPEIISELMLPIFHGLRFKD